MEEITYSQHLEFRLKLRLMPRELPRTIYQESEERYLDIVTGLNIAVGVADYQGKMRELAVAFRKDNNRINLITIHPLKSNQKLRRVILGRWRKI